jgi:LysM repeat protein/lysophospholipase L1-like esterase
MKNTFNLLRFVSHRTPWRLNLSLWLFGLSLISCLDAQNNDVKMPEGSLPMLNYIQYGDSASIVQWNQRRQQSELQGLPLQILHIGDSHIQSGALTLIVRKRLQQVFGSGGLGLMFPYSAAKTYTPRGYKTRYSGKFLFAKSFTLPPKLPLGLMGATVKTQDSSASLRFIDLPSQPLNSSYIVEVWADGSDSMFQLEVKQGKEWKRLQPVDKSPFYTQVVPTEEVRILSDTSTDGVELVNRELPVSTIFFEDWKVYRAVVPAADSVVIRFHKTSEVQRQIEIYAVNIFSVGPNEVDSGLLVAQPGGLLYHTAGMGGARFESLLYASLLPQQLQYLNPQFVVLDFGTNDIAPLLSFPDKLREQIELSVDIVQQALPNSLVMLVTPMDMEFKGNKVVHTYPLSIMMKEIAQQKGCLLWDFYWLAGAKNSLPRWQSAKKVSTDGIHMTEPGYWLKGDLLASAMLEFFSIVNTGELPAERWLNEDSVWLVWNGILSNKMKRKPAISANGNVNRASMVTGTSTASSPTVAKGSSANPKLSPFLNPQAAIAPVKKTPNAAVVGANKSKVVEKKMRHTVKPGEDIFDIAFEFGVTVAQIKQWNGLTSNSVQPGKVIVIVKSAPIGPRR